MFDLQAVSISHTVTEGYLDAADWAWLLAEGVSCQEMQQRTKRFMDGLGLGQSRRQQACRDGHEFATNIVRAVLIRSTDNLIARIDRKNVHSSILVWLDGIEGEEPVDFVPSLPRVPWRRNARVDWPRQRDADIIKSFQRSTLARAPQIRAAILARSDAQVRSLVADVWGHGGLACVVWTLLDDFSLRLHPTSDIETDDLADILIAWAEDEDINDLEGVFAQPALDAVASSARETTARIAGKGKDRRIRRKTQQTLLRGNAKSAILPDLGSGGVKQAGRQCVVLHFARVALSTVQLRDDL